MNEKDKINNIVKGCLNNDRKSQKLLFDLYASKLMAISYRYMGNYDEANEVLQESFIKIFNKLSTYNPLSAHHDIYNWIKPIVVNTAIDFLRKRKQERKKVINGQDHLFKITEYDEMFDFESIKRNEKLTKLLMNALLKLSPAYKLVFNMYVIEEYTHIEIAKELGISEGTSKSNLFKAKAKLKKLLENDIKFIY